MIQQATFWDFHSAQCQSTLSTLSTLWAHSEHSLSTLRDHPEFTQRTLRKHSLDTNLDVLRFFFKFYEVLRCWLSPYVSSSFLGYFSSNGKKSDKLHSLSKLCNSAQFWPFHLKVRMMRKKHAKISHEVETFGVFEEYCSKHRVKTRAWHPKDGYLQYPDLIAALGNQSA